LKSKRNISKRGKRRVGIASYNPNWKEMYKEKFFDKQYFFCYYKDVIHHTPSLEIKTRGKNKWN
jgi:hypothetical protein